MLLLYTMYVAEDMNGVWLQNLEEWKGREKKIGGIWDMLLQNNVED